MPVRLKSLSVIFSGSTPLYDILDHPAILVTRDDGSVMQLWQGKQLPLMAEVAAYTAG